MLQFSCVDFENLSTDELYKLLALRQAIFSVEQNCAYLDADGMDRNAFHVLGINPQGELQAYARLFAAKNFYDDYAAIGRICTSASVRSQGEGRRLVSYCLSECFSRFPGQIIKISAQKYLLNFYQDFGFSQIGKEYLEDGIPHIAMLYEHKNIYKSAT
jgi:ElaA protein